MIAKDPTFILLHERIIFPKQNQATIPDIVNSVDVIPWSRFVTKEAISDEYITTNAMSVAIMLELVLAISAFVARPIPSEISVGSCVATGD